MATATVKTVQFVDPRIEPQPDPVYSRIISPTQNQYYCIPASGVSNSSLTFNNLTTLGVDRAYLDTFEIEVDATITFDLQKNHVSVQGEGSKIASQDLDVNDMCPKPDEWTFQSFPLNTCCDEARVNINGGSFFSQPMCYVRPKERYMNQYELSKCYENICPIHKPVCQYESGRTYDQEWSPLKSEGYNTPMSTSASIVSKGTEASHNVTTTGGITNLFAASSGANALAAPTRYGAGMFNFMQSDQGMEGGFNNSILRLGAVKKDANQNIIGWENYYRDGNQTIVHVVWREPIFCSPFSSRYDANYGRPLYNITSMDLAFTFMDLGNMIRLSNLHSMNKDGLFVKNYNVKINNARLCYQVMTIPPTIQKPLTTLVPYRRFVPYITNMASSIEDTNVSKLNKKMEVKSGVYTLNEVPTAIWIFCAPQKDRYQTNVMDYCATETTDVSQIGVYDDSPADLSQTTLCHGNWESNKLFAYLEHVDITMANTTQILNQATPLDLYRIAKANGCEDSFLSWGAYDTCYPKMYYVRDNARGGNLVCAQPMYYGAGSVLRVKPGVDLIVPDIPLIPGANAKNMVIQVTAEFTIPPNSRAQNKYALWLLFEYVGVAAISPGQCEISMNPLGDGEAMAISPVISATSNNSEGELGGGAGFWDKAKKAAEVAGQVAETGIISKILRSLGANKAADWMSKHGLGEPAAKRSRGGAVMGRGLNDWI